MEVGKLSLETNKTEKYLVWQLGQLSILNGLLGKEDATQGLTSRAPKRVSYTGRTCEHDQRKWLLTPGTQP